MAECPHLQRMMGGHKEGMRSTLLVSVCPQPARLLHSPDWLLPALPRPGLGGGVGFFYWGVHLFSHGFMGALIQPKCLSLVNYLLHIFSPSQ